MTLVKKHNDPYKFLLAVIDQMNRGKLKLKRIGAATTREVAALWNDHNNNKIPASMVESFQQYITEAFDKPYKWKYVGGAKPSVGIQDWQEGNFKGSRYSFETHDKRAGEITIFEWDIVPPKPKFPVNLQRQGRVMEMHFAIETEWEQSGAKGTEMSGDITGKGDAMRIFATVLDVVGKYVKKNKPDIIRVMGAKTKDAEIGGRLKLYKKLIKRYTSKLGYKYDDKVLTVSDRRTRSGLELAVMRVVRKGYDSRRGEPR